MNEMYIIGGGGTAKDVYSALKDRYEKVTIVLPEGETVDWHERFIHDSEFEDILESASDKIEIVIAISNNLIRKKIAEKLSRFENAKFPNVFLSDPVFLSQDFTMGIGNIFYPLFAASFNVKVGNFNIFNYSVWLPHDVVVENYVTVETNASISGMVRIKEGATIAAGTAILPGVTIGKFSIVGIGAVVLRNVPDGVTVIGNPGKVVFHKRT